MKRISVQDLKAQLSTAIADAESGSTLIITRHNNPVARLSPALPPAVHRGARAGTGRLLPALKRGTNGRALAILVEDRGAR